MVHFALPFNHPRRWGVSWAKQVSSALNGTRLAVLRPQRVHPHPWPGPPPVAAEGNHGPGWNPPAQSFSGPKTQWGCQGPKANRSSILPPVRVVCWAAEPLAVALMRLCVCTGAQSGLHWCFTAFSSFITLLYIVGIWYENSGANKGISEVRPPDCIEHRTCPKVVCVCVISNWIQLIQSN